MKYALWSMPFTYTTLTLLQHVLVFITYNILYFTYQLFIRIKIKQWFNQLV